MEGVQLVALMGSDTLAAMRSAEPLDLSPGDTTRIPVDIALSNAALRKAMSEVGTGMKSQVTVTGDAFYHTWLGTKKFTGAFNKTYEVDFDRILGSMGNRLFQGLFLAP